MTSSLDRLLLHLAWANLSQANHHATEHRAHIASALEEKGFAPVDLDERDLWAYEIASEN